jgi:competence protein ComEC
VAGLLLFVVCFIYCSNGPAVPEAAIGFDHDQEYTGQVVTYPVIEASGQYFDIYLPAAFKIRIYTSRDINVARGDRISCQGRAVAANNTYYTSLQIKALIFCSSARVVTPVQDPLQQLANVIRNRLDSFCRANLPEPEASLVLGMLIGSSENFPATFTAGMLISGTAHIIAVSGFNVNFVAASVLAFAAKLGRKRAILIAFPVLLFYLLIVGMDNSPALRATIMNCYFLTAVLLGVKADYLNAAGLALLLILLLNPYASLGLGVQLSFAAVLGQFFLFRQLQKILKSDIICMCVACSIGTMPIILLSLGVVYPWSIPVNILLAPFIPLVMELAALGIPAALLCPVLKTVILLPLNAVLHFLVLIISACSSLPVGAIEPPPLLSLLFIALLISILLWFFKFRNSHEIKLV